MRFLRHRVKKYKPLWNRFARLGTLSSTFVFQKNCHFSQISGVFLGKKLSPKAGFHFEDMGHQVRSPGSDLCGRREGVHH